MLHLLGVQECKRMTRLPESLWALTALQTLDLAMCEGLRGLPEGLSALTALEGLNLRSCKRLTGLPEGLSALTALKTLDLERCEGLRVLPEGLSALTALQTLILWGSTELTSLPEGLSALTVLHLLGVQVCKRMTRLPESLWALTALQTLDLAMCGGLRGLPEGLSELTALTTLDLTRCEGLRGLPEGLSVLTALQTLNLYRCRGLRGLPEGLSALTALQTLDLFWCSGLTALPEGLSALTALQTLNLEGCRELTGLPEGLSALTALQMLDLYGCSELPALPEGLSALTALRTLDLTGCSTLQALPPWISALTALVVLDLEDCPAASPKEQLESGIESLPNANVHLNLKFKGQDAADGRTEAISALILAGADPNIPCEPSGFTAIHWATESGHAQAITALIQGGADPNIVDQDKHTPFSIAAKQKSSEALKALLEGGADTDKMAWAERIYLVKGVDRGRDAWYYVLVEPCKIPSFLAALNDNIIHLENYGKILKSGYGEAPPACVTQALEEFSRIEEKFPTGTAEQILRAIAQSQLVQTAQELVRAENWISLADIADDLLLIARDLRSAMPEVAKAIFSWLGICYNQLGQYTKAIEHYEQHLTVAEEVGDRAGQGGACNSLGYSLAKNGDAAGAARVLLRGLAVWQRVEEDVGAHDDRRVSLFEDQQTTYMHLQDVLMRQEGRAGWALGVAAEGKARALAYRLGAVGESHGGGGDSEDGEQSADRPYEDVCESWWMEVQRLARGEGAKTRVIEFSFLSDGKVGIWVLSGDTGELLCSKVVSSTWLAGSRGLSIQEALAEARKSMGVRGRDAMREAPDALCASTRQATDLVDASLSTDEPASSGRSIATKMLRKELYQTLIAPVEAALEGAEELLIVPSMELFEVPWAALTDEDGSYLMERYIIRTAPSLRVARQAADKTQEDGNQPRKISRKSETGTQEQIAEKVLDMWKAADINELYLFHGTSSETAMLICQNGFDPAAASTGGLYRAGIHPVLPSGSWKELKFVQLSPEIVKRIGSHLTAVTDEMLRNSVETMLKQLLARSDLQERERLLRVLAMH